MSPADLVVPFGLILNELATNALKHGVLSAPNGTVELTWHVEPAAGRGRRLNMDWIETGGPIVSVPGPNGFGSTLIEKSLPNANVTRVFGPDGLACKIEVELYRS